MKNYSIRIFLRCQPLPQHHPGGPELFVTQPAISTAIKELEKEFSVNLFVRSKTT